MAEASESNDTTENWQGTDIIPGLMRSEVRGGLGDRALAVTVTQTWPEAFQTEICGGRVGTDQGVRHPAGSEKKVG